MARDKSEAPDVDDVDEPADELDLDEEDLDVDDLDEDVDVLEDDVDVEVLDEDVEVADEFDDEDEAAAPDVEVEIVPLATFDDDDDDDDDDVLVVADEDDQDEQDAVKEGEFVCRSCFLVKGPSQLADAKNLLCRDCA